jgi:hypothetical protein
VKPGEILEVARVAGGLLDALRESVECVEPGGPAWAALESVRKRGDALACALLLREIEPIADAGANMLDVAKGGQE